MSEAVSMEKTKDGNVKVTVGCASMIFADFVSAAEWAESLLYSEGDEDGH